MFKSEKIKNYFEENGWYEGREIDISLYKDMYQKFNIKPNPLALNLLKEFGGIYLKLPSKSSNYYTSLILDPSEGEVTLEELKEFEETMGEKLTPLGFFPRSTLDIYISNSNKFYFAGSYEFMYIVFIGSDFYEMLEVYFNKEYLDQDRFPNLFPED
ncbi:SUKH-3 domain-containing protein [Paenibacillus sp. FSL L8-0463]|uniref:SUKH-3 domain-containing protein n=1 Tax=Paenibacillus sp. FSL L8-0463 TaxID=2954687 RepID=UPI003119E50F